MAIGTTALSLYHPSMPDDVFIGCKIWRIFRESILGHTGFPEHDKMLCGLVQTVSIAVSGAPDSLNAFATRRAFDLGLLRVKGVLCGRYTDPLLEVWDGAGYMPICAAHFRGEETNQPRRKKKPR